MKKIDYQFFSVYYLFFISLPANSNNEIKKL